MPAVDPSVELRLPPELFGGDPVGLIRFMGFAANHVADDRWSVKLADPRADLINTYTLADESGRAHRFDFLDRVPTFHPIPDPRSVHQYNELERRLMQRITSGASGDIAALFHLTQLKLSTVDHQDLPNAVRVAYDGIGSIPLEGTNTPLFVNRSAHLIRASDELIRRVRLPGIIFRFDQDPDPMSTLTAVLERESGPEYYFGSSADWYLNVIGLSDYVGPLLGCLTPRMWGFQSHRALSVILMSLGTHINGFLSAPMEPMQLLPVSGPTDRTMPSPELPRASGADAVDWWTMRLNQMFRYLSDPTTFRDANGGYAAHEHHHWMLTFGQIFALTTSLQCAGRDFTAQRVIMNDLLGAFADRIMPVGTDFERLCTLSFAEKKAAAVRQAMPNSVAAILMPAVDRAVKALAEVQDGFFIQRQRGDAMVRLRQPDGIWRELAPERAAARLMHIHRNATHGYGHRKGARKKNEQNASLLVHHNGHLPADIVLLPYLYLLDTLCNPDRVRHDIVRKVATD